MNKEYDLIIVGAGPSGVFTAYELIELGLAKDKKIVYNSNRLRAFRCLFIVGRGEESRSGL